MAGVRIRALTTPRLIKLTSTRCRSARQLNIGRRSTYQGGDSVQTTGATSGYALHSVRQQTVSANWKLLVEAFLEAYHVPFVHRKTLAPATLSFKWLTDVYGMHGRAVYPLQRLTSDLNLEMFPLRRYISVVYHIFPNSFVSFQPFHALVTHFVPLAPDLTR